MHIVHTESSQGWGGQEIRILTEATSMLARGHRVTLLTPPSAPIYAEAQKRGIETVGLPLEKKRLRGLFAVTRWLRQNPTVDVINTHSSTDSWLIGLAVMLLGKKIGIVRTRHISAPVRNTASNRWLYGTSANKVVTTGESLRQDLIKTLSLPADHVVSIPTGIDLERFSLANTPGRNALRSELGIPNDAFVIGIVATLRSWKGHDDLLDAFAPLAAQDRKIHLVIAGDGPRKAHLKEKIKSMSCSSSIHMLGHREDIPTILASLDLFVLPSYANEGVPQAIMQAMAMGVPVISSEVGAISDAVQNQISGLLIPPRNPKTLSEAILKMQKDSDKILKLGENSLTISRMKFSINSMADSMESIFNSVKK